MEQIKQESLEKCRVLEEEIERAEEAKRAAEKKLKETHFDN